MNIQWYPGHMTKTRRMIAEQIKNVDAVCEILDARIPVSSRNPDVDELTAGKPRMVVLNRVDQADPEGTKRWAEHFRAKGYAVLESDAKSGVGTAKFAGAVRELLADKLRANGCPRVIVHDLARCDMAQAVADAFRYSKLVLATTTYNADVFPFMKEFIHHLTERNFRNRTVALMENGSWAPLAAKVMRKMLEECKNLTFTETTVRILSALNETSAKQVDALANELSKEYLAQQDATANKNDLTALFNIGYGLYVVTTNDGTRDNGLIVNTVSQVTNTPNRIAVTINKQNYSFHTIQKTGVLNVNCLDVSAPFSLFQRFGFQSGRTVDKFAGMEVLRSDNGLAFLPRYINSFMSLKVESYVDMDTHGMFICTVTEARVMSDAETMTYTYYQKNVKPKPETEGKHGFVCKVCGWIYEGDELPDDIICPLCKHGAADFEPIG